MLLRRTLGCLYMSTRRSSQLGSSEVKSAITTTSSIPASQSKDHKLEKLPESSLLAPCVKECDLVMKRVPAYVPMKSVRVAVLNAYHPANMFLCFMLKINKLIKEIRMYDENRIIDGTAMDIAHIDTSTKVISCIGKHQLKRALAKADIVVINAPAEPNDMPNSKEVFQKNAQLIKEMAEECIAHCPEAIFVITAYPITSTVPLFSEILLQNGVLCPNRVMGSMALKEMRMRTLAAISLGLDPASVEIDLIGGGTPQTVVPVISGVRPGGQYLRNDFNKLYKKLINMSRELLAVKKTPATLSAGYAVSLLISNIAKGLCGRNHTPTSVFLRTSALYGVKYLSVPVMFGLSGVEINLGVPALSNLEMETLDKALAELQTDIRTGESYGKPKVLDKPQYLEEDEDEITSAIMPRCGLSY